MKQTANVPQRKNDDRFTELMNYQLRQEQRRTFVSSRPLARFRGAHAPRVLISAPRRNPFVCDQVRDGEGAIAGTRGACAPRISRCGATKNNQRFVPDAQFPYGLASAFQSFNKSLYFLTGGVTSAAGTHDTIFSETQSFNDSGRIEISIGREDSLTRQLLGHVD